MSTETASYLAIAALIVAGLALLLALWVLLRARRLSRLSTFRPQMPADLQDRVERGERRRLCARLSRGRRRTGHEQGHDEV